MCKDFIRGNPSQGTFGRHLGKATKINRLRCKSDPRKRRDGSWGGGVRDYTVCGVEDFAASSSKTEGLDFTRKQWATCASPQGLGREV